MRATLSWVDRRSAPGSAHAIAARTSALPAPVRVGAVAARDKKLSCVLSQTSRGENRTILTNHYLKMKDPSLRKGHSFPRRLAR